MVNKCVIDIGSNTIKLFIAEVRDNKEIIPIELKRRMTQLGKNINKTGKLPEDSKKLVIEYLNEYLEITKRHQIKTKNILLTGTAACRNASDGQKFINQLKNMFNLPHAKILSGTEEAQYTFLGVLESIKSLDNEYFCVFDVGGGSFQLSIGTKNNFLQGTSIQKGCNSTTEEFELSQKIDQNKLFTVIEYFKNYNIEDLKDLSTPIKVVGVGGTLKIIQLMLKNIDDFTPIKIDSLLSTTEWLATKSVEERFKWFEKKYPDETFRIDTGLTRNRAEVFLAGLCIVIGILQKLSAQEVILSNTDAKDYIIRLDHF